MTSAAIPSSEHKQHWKWTIDQILIAQLTSIPAAILTSEQKKSRPWCWLQSPQRWKSSTQMQLRPFQLGRIINRIPISQYTLACVTRSLYPTFSTELLRAADVLHPIASAKWAHASRARRRHKCRWSIDCFQLTQNAVPRTIFREINDDPCVVLHLPDISDWGWRSAARITLR